MITLIKENKALNDLFNNLLVEFIGIYLNYLVVSIEYLNIIKL